MNAAREQGIRLPEDLKVAGIDDYAMPPSEILPLTTYRIPYEGMGRRAFELLSQASDSQAFPPLALFFSFRRPQVILLYPEPQSPKMLKRLFNSFLDPFRLNDILSVTSV